MKNHPEINNVQDVTGGIKTHGNGPLQTSPADFGCGSVLLSLIDSEVFNNGTRQIDPYDFETSRMKHFFHSGCFIPKQSHKCLSDMSEFFRT